MTAPTLAQDTVHAPLAHWAHVRGDAVALDDGHTRLSFAQLHTAVTQGAQALSQAQAPAAVFVNEGLSTLGQVVDFLAIVASGRCAAVGDPDWPQSTRARVQHSLHASASQHPTPAAAFSAESPFYIGFTSGSTGMPKGFQRHHRSWTESFQVCLDTFGAAAQTRVLAPGRVSHSLFLFGMLMGLWTGAGVVVQERFSAARALETLRLGHTPCWVAVPSQLAMLLEHAQRRAVPPITGLSLLLISGARWMRERTPELKALFPEAQVVEFYGASETSFIAWMNAEEDAPAQAVGRPFPGVQLDIRPPSGPANPQQPGLIYVRSPMLFMDYVGQAPDSTAALRDGDWLSVRDIGYIDTQGYLCLVGRENRMVVTQGKNLFPEEVEAALCATGWVAYASVHGVPDPLRGQQVVAVVHPQAPARPTALALAHSCREALEPYKVPRRFFTCEAWPLTPSGKTDHQALGQMLAQTLTHPEDTAPPCLYPLS